MKGSSKGKRSLAINNVINKKSPYCKHQRKAEEERHGGVELAEEVEEVRVEEEGVVVGLQEPVRRGRVHCPQPVQHFAPQVLVPEGERDEK